MNDTAERILEAATRVFARDGVSGATTREIARLAKVNEVTVFRAFKNKNELLRQVVLKSCEHYRFAFEETPLETPEDLRRAVQTYADLVLRKLRENEELIRTFYGELKRHPKLCRRLFVESAKPVRQKFMEFLKLAQKKGLVRASLDPVTTADALAGMLAVGILRRPLTDPEYSNDQFCATCLDLFLKGIQP